jgi:ketosteroid isomerase-like protein
MAEQPAASGGGSVGPESLEARLRRLEDLEAIRQLFVDYGHYLDYGDFEAYGKLFADDGEVLLGPMGRASGPTAIQALMEKALGGRRGNSFHLISNPIVHLHGDRATSDVMWAVLVRDDNDRPQLPMVGRHKDVLTRRNGEWKFLRREGHIDIPGSYPR